MVPALYISVGLCNNRMVLLLPIPQLVSTSLPPPLPWRSKDAPGNNSSAYLAAPLSLYIYGKKCFFPTPLIHLLETHWWLFGVIFIRLLLPHVQHRIDLQHSTININSSVPNDECDSDSRAAAALLYGHHGPTTYHDNFSLFHKINPTPTILLDNHTSHVLGHSRRQQTKSTWSQLLRAVVVVDIRKKEQRFCMSERIYMVAFNVSQTNKWQHKIFTKGNKRLK